MIKSQFSLLENKNVCLNFLRREKKATKRKSRSKVEFEALYWKYVSRLKADNNILLAVFHIIIRYMNIFDSSIKEGATPCIS